MGTLSFSTQRRLVLPAAREDACLGDGAGKLDHAAPAEGAAFNSKPVRRTAERWPRWWQIDRAGAAAGLPLPYSHMVEGEVTGCRLIVLMDENYTGLTSPDGSRFAYTITRGPGDRPTVLSGWEIRVDP